MARTQHPKVTGMTQGEREIMDLWDAGQSMQVIAHRLGLSITTVRGVVSNLNTSGLDAADRAHAAAMRHGSEDLASAIQRARGA